MHGASGHRTFIGIAALCFVASVTVTVSWCGSMAPGGMEMPGGWTMSMAWMRMPGQGWPGAAATFVGMWSVMMIAMMLPALVPMLLQYRRALGNTMRMNALTWRVAGGYFAVWTAAGLMAFPIGSALAELAMRVPPVARATPFVAGLVTLVAGVAQLTAWKTRQVACCRHTIDCCRPPTATPHAAWGHGVNLGIRCLRCCAPLTALLLVTGVMDWHAMAAVTIAITLERVMSRGERAARAIGIAMITVALVSLT